MKKVDIGMGFYKTSIISISIHLLLASSHLASSHLELQVKLDNDPYIKCWESPSFKFTCDLAISKEKGKVGG